MNSHKFWFAYFAGSAAGIVTSLAVDQSVNIELVALICGGIAFAIAAHRALTLDAKGRDNTELEDNGGRRE